MLTIGEQTKMKIVDTNWKLNFCQQLQTQKLNLGDFHLVLTRSLKDVVNGGLNKIGTGLK